MPKQPVNKHHLLSTLPPETTEDLLPEIRRRLRASGRKLVVIDDDPLGTQTVYDLPILTEWSVKSLAAEFADDLHAFYVLTNSRAMPPPEAAAVNAEVGRNLLEAARLRGRPFSVVSRCDSTLRGHFPQEVAALSDALGGEFDAWVLVPFFLEGGRYTVGDVHYVAEGDSLIPAGETEFARDVAFGYRSSNLREWVEEKTGGRIPAGDVRALSIEDIRLGGAGKVTDRLMNLPRGCVCIVNVACMRDLEIFTLGLLAAEERGRRFLYRTASSFIQARLGLAPRRLLTPDELSMSKSGGGLIIVGSHVPRTTAQLTELLARPGISGIEVDVPRLLDSRREGEIARAVEKTTEALEQRRNAVVYTSREVIAGHTAEQSLAISRQVSQGLVEVVRALDAQPRYLLIKGGITSSDVCTRALGVRRAMVLGQVVPGVPVWRLGDESRWPQLPCIVFPGNVGGPEALAEVVEKLSALI